MGKREPKKIDDENYDIKYSRYEDVPEWLRNVIQKLSEFRGALSITQVSGITGVSPHVINKDFLFEPHLDDFEDKNSLTTREMLEDENQIKELIRRNPSPNVKHFLRDTLNDNICIPASDMVCPEEVRNYYEGFRLDGWEKQLYRRLEKLKESGRTNSDEFDYYEISCAYHSWRNRKNRKLNVSPSNRYRLLVRYLGLVDNIGSKLGSMSNRLKKYDNKLETDIGPDTNWTVPVTTLKNWNGLIERGYKSPDEEFVFDPKRLKALETKEILYSEGSKKSPRYGLSRIGLNFLSAIEGEYSEKEQAV